MSSSNNNPTKKFAWYMSMSAKIDAHERKHGKPNGRDGGSGRSSTPNPNAGKSFLASPRAPVEVPAAVTTGTQEEGKE